MRSHRATTERLGADPAAVGAILEKGPAAADTPRMRALLAIAGAVRGPVAPLSDEMVSAARAAGATDVEIHDAVLVASAFSMYNRYVESLATPAPDDPSLYAMHAERLATQGYARRP